MKFFYIIIFLLYISCNNKSINKQNTLKSKAEHNQNNNYSYKDRFSYVIVKNDERCEILETSGIKISKNKYLDISHFSEGFFSARKIVNNDTLAGYINKEGVEFNFFYNNCYTFNNGYAIIYKNGKYRIINKKFEYLSDYKFDFALPFRDGFAPVKINGKWTFINEKGQLIHKPEFDGFYYFHEGLAPIKINELWGYINTSGKIVIKTKFTRIHEFKKNGLALVSNQENETFFINKKGNIAFKNENYTFQNVTFNKYNLIKVGKTYGEKIFYGYVDVEGNKKIPLKYLDILPFPNYPYTSAKIKGQKKNNYIIIDTLGHRVGNLSFDYINYFYKGGVAIVTKKVNDKEFEHLKFKISNAKFNYILNNGIKGVIDTLGNVKIPLKYKDLSPVYAYHTDKLFEGQCLFMAQNFENEKIGIIDDNNKVLIPFNYDYFTYRYLGKGIFYLNKNGKQIFFDILNQKEILIKDYKFIGILDYATKNNLYLFQNKDGKVGVRKGLYKWIIHPKYDKIDNGMKMDNLWKLK